MWPVSAAFLAAHRAPSQTMTIRAEVWDDTGKQLDLQVQAGSVSIDSRRATRRTVTVDLVDPTGDLVPRDAAGLLVPTGAQIRLWRGIVLPDGEVEEAPLGVFRIDQPKFTLNTSGLAISLTGSDESATVSANRLTQPWVWVAGTPVGSSILALVTDRHPRLSVRDETDPTVVFGSSAIVEAGAESDPWQSALDVAAQFGLELLIDAEGVAVVRPIPNPATPVVSYARGPEAVIISAERSLSTETTYSGVVVSSDTSDSEDGGTPIRVELWDTDPTSPTYADGRFGRKPYFLTSHLISTVDQATATATAHLPQVTGILDTLTWDQITNPALDAGDLVELYDEDLRINALLTIESLTIPLDPAGAMAAVTRSRQLRPFTEIVATTDYSATSSLLPGDDIHPGDIYPGDIYPG